MKIKCSLPENNNLFLTLCPKCSSNNIEESGDDTDGMVNCNDCGLATYYCYGTKAAINVWNKRKNMELWNFL